MEPPTTPPATTQIPLRRQHSESTGFFPTLSMLKKPRYYANFILREFTTTPVFVKHQFVFSSKINPATTPICVLNEKEKTKRERLNIKHVFFS